MPILLEPGRPKVLVVLDGIGWLQLQARPDVAPTLSAMEGGPITTVAPSTTATALTSITTGLTPGEHGLIGYRMMVDGQILNALRWGTKLKGDARKTIPPDSVQPFDPFLGKRVDYVSRAEFASSGFTKAHLRGASLSGYRTPALLVHETARIIKEGSPFVYAYYDGIDKVAHEFGLGSEYDAELRFVDRMVGDLIDSVPSGTQVVLTADHGQVDCGNNLVPVAGDLTPMIESLSGEARFRWLHAESGATAELLEAAKECHGDQAWVVSATEMVEAGWFGPYMRPEARDRLGDVALLPFEPTGFDDPDDSGPFRLISRHGSLTADEMLVPLLSVVS